jgi:hypothetical protein
LFLGVGLESHGCHVLSKYPGGYCRMAIRKEPDGVQEIRRVDEKPRVLWSQNFPALGLRVAPENMGGKGIMNKHTAGSNERRRFEQVLTMVEPSLTLSSIDLFPPTHMSLHSEIHGQTG